MRKFVGLLIFVGFLVFSVGAYNNIENRKEESDRQKLKVTQKTLADWQNSYAVVSFALVESLREQPGEVQSSILSKTIQKFPTNRPVDIAYELGIGKEKIDPKQLSADADQSKKDKAKHNK